MLALHSVFLRGQVGACPSPAVGLGFQPALPPPCRLGFLLQPDGQEATAGQSRPRGPAVFQADATFVTVQAWWWWERCLRSTLSWLSIARNVHFQRQRWEPHPASRPRHPSPDFFLGPHTPSPGAEPSPPILCKSIWPLSGAMSSFPLRCTLLCVVLSVLGPFSRESVPCVQ